MSCSLAALADLARGPDYLISWIPIARLVLPPPPPKPAPIVPVRITVSNMPTRHAVAGLPVSAQMSLVPLM